MNDTKQEDTIDAKIDKAVELMADFGMTCTSFPQTNVYRNSNYDIIVEMSVPGYSIDDLRINKSSAYLSVQGFKPQPLTAAFVKNYYQGFVPYGFNRGLVLSPGIYLMDTTLDEGVLRFTFIYQDHDTEVLVPINTRRRTTAEFLTEGA